MRELLYRSGIRQFMEEYRMESDQVWLAAVNLHAGSGKTVSLWREAERLLDRMQVRYDCRYAGIQFCIAEIAYGAAAEGFRRYIAVGGDGTIHDVLEGIMKYVEESSASSAPVRISDFTIAVVPIGSGNDWIRIHRIGYDLEETVSLIKAGSFVRQDVVKVSILPGPDGQAERGPGMQLPGKWSYMVNIGGVGFDARVCERVNGQKARGKRGKLLYIKALLYLFFHYRPFPATVLCDGEKVFEGDCFSVAVGNGKYCGGGLRQTPDAVFDDGLLDLTVIPASSVRRVLLELPKLFNGRFSSVKGLEICRGRTISVLPLAGRCELVEVDGEIIGSVPVQFEVLPEQINVLHKP